MPKVFWPILRNNRHLLNDVPALGAAALEFWAKARYGARVIVMVVQQTYGGFLNFYPQLHTLVSAGGLRESNGQWIRNLNFRHEDHKHELMLAWRFVLLAYLDMALKAGVLRSHRRPQELVRILKTEGMRRWNIFVGSPVTKRAVIDHIGRYIRRPPIAQRRLTRISEREVEYLAKDTKNKCFTRVVYKNEEFIALLIPHVCDRYRNGMRYFGLLAPRSKRLLSIAFTMLRKKKRPRPARLDWASSLNQTFGSTPLLGSDGSLLRWVSRIAPVEA